MLAFTTAGARVFRNNCGVLQDREGRWIRYGVANPGGSDLIGWQSIVITPKWIGRRVAVFVAVEAKSHTGRLTDEQRQFLEAVRAAGGVAIEARDVDATVEQLNSWQHASNEPTT